MTEQLKINRKQNITLAAGLMGLALLVILLCFLLIGHGSRSLNVEATHYLGEISEQLSYEADMKVAYDLSALKIISENLTLMDDELMLRKAYIQQAMEQYNFLWMGIVDGQGDFYSFSDQYIHVEALPAVIFRAMEGETSVSSTLLYDASGEPGLLYATPYRRGGQIVGALVSWNNLEGLQAIIARDTFDGEGFVHIIDQSGEFIVCSSNPNASISGSNFLEAFWWRADILEGGTLGSFTEDIANGRSGHLRFRLDGHIEEAMDYRYLDGIGWYVLSIVPMKVYAEALHQFIVYSVGINVLIFALFLLLIVILLRLNNQKNQEIARIAYVDPVTQGFTLPRFDLQLKKLLEKGEPFAFVSIDIRKFKLINDAYGSEDGNLVLRHIHRTINQHLGEGEYVARISADRFNIVLRTTEETAITEWLEAVGRSINRFNDQRDVPYYLRLDCGVYINDDDVWDIITIRDRANTARKSSKDRNDTIEQIWSNVAFYNDVDRIHLQIEKDMENSMEMALENKEFVVYLQPKVELSSQRIIGAEALIRWARPGDRVWMPGEFIPHFERNGFIVKLDLYVFEEICRLLGKWISEGRQALPISVNLSRAHLETPHFLEQFKRIQERYDVPPKLLEFELTETMVFENLELLKQLIDEIHRYGFVCSMDDFGSGYSSLNVIKDVKIDTLKLDKVFFDKENDPRGNDVIEAVINMARRLGMQTVSEGVESMAQVEFLRQVQCDIVQGYVFSKPMPVAEFEVKVAAERGKD